MIVFFDHLFFLLISVAQNVGIDIRILFLMYPK